MSKERITTKDVGVLEIGPDGQPRRVVSAVATMTGVGDLSGSRTVGLAARIEAAMKAAVDEALAEGVPMANVEEYRRRILAARERAIQGEAPASAKDQT